MMKRATTLALIALLSGCAAGPLSEDQPAARVGQVLVQLAQSVSSESEAPAGGGALTRAAIEAAPVDLLRVSLISLESTDVISQVGRNGSRVTWVSNDGASFTFDRGLLVASRGVGSDLMGANVRGAKASLSGGGTHTRIHDYLDGLDNIEQVTFRCRTVVTDAENITIFERTYQTTVLEETCRSGDLSFKNTYWRDRNGTIWQARQWISAQIGYLGYQRL